MLNPTKAPKLPQFPKFRPLRSHRNSAFNPQKYSNQLMLSYIEEVTSYLDNLSDSEDQKIMLEKYMQQLQTLLDKDKHPIPIKLAIKSCQVFMHILESKTSDSIHYTPTKIIAPRSHQNLNLKQFRATHKKYSSEHEDKILELSTICQQIPQLQIFRRTLIVQSELKDNKQNKIELGLRKIVDVLIELHNKVEEKLNGQLLELTRKSQPMKTQCSIFEQQVHRLKNKISQLLCQNALNSSLITSDRKRNNSSECFSKVHDEIYQLSQLICSILQQHHASQSQQLYEVSDMINLYREFIIKSLELGKTSLLQTAKIEHLNEELKRLEDEWAIYRKRDSGNIVQENIREVLQDCFDRLYDQIEQYSQIKQKSKQEQRERQELVKSLQQTEQQIQQLRVENDKLKEKLIKLSRSHSESQQKVQSMYINQQKDLKIVELQRLIDKLTNQIQQSKLQRVNQKTQDLEEIISLIQQDKCDQLLSFDDYEAMSPHADQEDLRIQIKEQLGIIDNFQRTTRQKQQQIQKLFTKIQESSKKAALFEMESKQLKIEVMKKIDEIAYLNTKIGHLNKELKPLKIENQQMKVQLTNYKVQLKKEKIVRDEAISKGTNGDRQWDCTKCRGQIKWLKQKLWSLEQLTQILSQQCQNLCRINKQ